MTPEQKATYRRLCRQVGEANEKLQSNGKLKPNLFNNRLARLKAFLRELPEDYSGNRFMRMEPIPHG